MRFALSLLVILVAAILAFAKATQELKPVIVSYPKGTPNHFLEDAKKAVLEAGGIVTHEYNLIKAFACKAPAKVIDKVRALGAEHNILIEEDQTVSINAF